MIIPVLENPGNRQSWPEVVSKDVDNHLYQLRSTVYSMWGQLRGRTLLPLPFGRDQLQRAHAKALER